MIRSDYVVLIPAYNEARTIRTVAERVVAHGHRVIVIDDGSDDGTVDQLAGLPLLVLRNSRNKGKAAALWLGMQCALQDGARWIITLDADGQHDPVEIPRFVECSRRYPDALIVGSRLHAKNAIPPARYRANRFANFWIAWAAGQAIIDSQCGFRLYPATVLSRAEVGHKPRHGFVFESEILIDAGRAGSPIVALPIAAIYEATARPSHFRPVVDIARIARMITVKLLSRALDLRGLVRSITGRPLVCEPMHVKPPRVAPRSAAAVVQEP